MLVVVTRTLTIKYKNKMTKQKFNELCNALETRKRNDGTEFICKVDNLDTDVANIIDNILCDNYYYSNLDLSYDIMYQALLTLEDIGYENTKTYDTTETNREHASVYITTRLSYLNNHNQDEITEFVKSYNVDIQTACAMWFDEQVNSTLNLLLEKVNE